MAMEQAEAQERFDAGYRQAELHSRDGLIEEKPYGQTTPDNYPWTYWWIKGYNTFNEEFNASPTE